MQLIARHPDIPEELELSSDDRNKLAEIMMEYPQGNPIKHRQGERWGSKKNEENSHA